MHRKKFIKICFIIIIFTLNGNYCETGSGDLNNINYEIKTTLNNFIGVIATSFAQSHVINYNGEMYRISSPADL